MGFYFRKRVGLGPLALNLGKSGIGISTGVRGLRAGISSHGKLYTSANLQAQAFTTAAIISTTMPASRPASPWASASA